jgi:hypothetical protein
MWKRKDGFIGKLLSFLLVIGLLFLLAGCSRPSIDKLLVEFDSTLTEYFTLVKAQNETGLDPAKMAKLTKLSEKMETLYAQFERVDESSLTEEQLTKLFSIMQKLSQLEF